MEMPRKGLSADIRSRVLPVSDLNMHILEAGPKEASPLILLLHGFPELSYSWRKILGPLSQAGYHVVAPDQRGYGLTTSKHNAGIIRYEDDVSSFRMMNLVRDMVALVHALGYTSVAAVVGHDFGSLVAAYFALARPDMAKSVVMMSAPFDGAPSTVATPIFGVIGDMLAASTPPRKHYMAYNSGPEANAHMHLPPVQLKPFLRAYFHVKSADCEHSNPRPLASAKEMPLLPHYYIMPLHDSMPDVVKNDAPSAAQIAQNQWMTDEDLAIYTEQFSTTGFQGGLNWYRCMTDPKWTEELALFSGKKIEIPSMYIAGKGDWGTFQRPGAFEAMQTQTCTNMRSSDVILIEGAGHWVPQEKPLAVVDHIRRFLDAQRPASLD